MIKVLSVFGTRPEAIKMAPVLKALQEKPQQFMSRVCVTAQHRQMLDQVLELFHIVPDYDLDLMEPGQSPLAVAARVLKNLEPIIRSEQPDWLLIQGDTTTVVAAAIAGYYTRVRVGHIEAGLRTYDKYQPFPEELNRRIASVVADRHFAPTQIARQNLLNEGISDDSIVVTGNTVIDALLEVVAMPIDWNTKPLDAIPRDRRLLLVTVHRRENFGTPIEEVCYALRDLVQRFAGEIEIVFPVHLNPNVQEPVNRLLSAIPGITLLPPLDYLPLAHLLAASHLVLTDSGGIQEEAPSLGKPVLVLRETTERPEAVTAGTVKLVGAKRTRIVEAATELLINQHEYDRMACAINPYGDGTAAKRIVAALAQCS